MTRQNRNRKKNQENSGKLNHCWSRHEENYPDMFYPHYGHLRIPYQEKNKLPKYNNKITPYHEKI